MNERIVSMIQELSKTNQRISLSDLSEKYGVSQRTIRNDLNSINDILENNGLNPLSLEKGGQIIRDSSFQRVLVFVEKKDFYDYKLSKEERKKIAAVLLISSSGFITLSEIAEHMFVSRATVIHDLDILKTYIKNGNLEIYSHPNKGLRVEGLESDKRVFLLKLMDYSPETQEQDVVRKQMAMDPGTEAILGKILSEQEHVNECFLNDASYQKIVTYLGIMTVRMRKGEYIEVRAKKRNSKYGMAQNILKYTEQYCGIKATEDEIQFLSELLSFGRYIKQKHSDQNSVRIQMQTRHFIECVSEDLGLDLNRDYDFFESLSNHLESVFSLPAANYERNAVIERVLEENKEVLEIVKRRNAVIQECAGRQITEQEFGYIAVHVCAAIERKKNKEISFHVIVACHSGIGTSYLLLEKLKQHFNFQIIDIVSSHETKNLLPGQADFIISTVPLKECRIEHMIVSPLLSDEDYLKIGSMIDRLRKNRNLPLREKERKKTAKELLGKMLPVIYDQVPEKADELSKKISRVVMEYFQESFELDDDIFSPLLYQLLPPGHIQLDVECKDWRQAVRESAREMLKSGYIEERYVEAMIRNIEENGPYIVISKGFALPHDGVDQGTKKLGMNLIRLKHPVCFGDDEKDPVEFVCCLSAVDHKSHLRAFFNLVNMLRKEEFKEALRASQTPDDMTDTIKRYELMTEKE